MLELNVAGVGTAFSDIDVTILDEKVRYLVDTSRHEQIIEAIAVLRVFMLNQFKVQNLLSKLGLMLFFESSHLGAWVHVPETGNLNIHHYTVLQEPDILVVDLLVLDCRVVLDFAGLVNGFLLSLVGLLTVTLWLLGVDDQPNLIVFAQRSED